MISKSELLKDKALCRDRAIGSLVGLAIGDSFGDAARTPENHFMFGITMDFQDGKTWSTDDTEFALLTANTLIESGGELTPEHVLSAWKNHVLVQSEFPRGGASEREAALNIKRGLLPPETGRFNSYNISDGAAMRVGPIGIVNAGDPARARQQAEIDAQISHWRDGIWGAQAVAAAVATAMADGTVDEIVAAAVDAAPADSWLRHTLEKSLAIVDGAASLEEAWMPLHHALVTEYKAAVPEAVSEAICVFKLTGGDFRKGIIYGSNFGRDSDTIAAIVGAISGAKCGLSGIPPAWAEKCRYPSGTCLAFTKGLDIFDLGQKLADLIG